MAELLEKNDRNETEIEKGKLSVAILKQMNNDSRLVLDAYKCKQKAREVNERES